MKGCRFCVYVYGDWVGIRWLGWGDWILVSEVSFFLGLDVLNVKELCYDFLFLFCVLFGLILNMVFSWVND